ncbi:hypothetical protein TGAM01_v202321 [Trichoderma gamsii]|uniref:Uncharacterized protein n=1 Tax=Trichoderma gamsii TaxID=398673 RepID=A0A2P4ZY74_9HYPO|nr:hypothetical protein TGAM01_v202321 [Trichoderma gamsii]PON29213.1 hypothetical protein TGAM01_v202321 [Trichoderma gamsii]
MGWAYRDGCTPGQIQSFVPASSARVKDLDVRRPAFRTYSIGADKSTTSTNIHIAHATVAVVGPGHRDGQIRPSQAQPDPEVMGAKGRMDGQRLQPPSFSSLCPCNTMRQAHAPPILAHLMDRWAAITTFQGPSMSRPGALLEEAPMPTRQHQVPLRRKPCFPTHGR